MKFFRNKEIQMELVLFLASGGILTLVSAFWLREKAAAVFFSSIVLLAVHLGMTAKRYRQIETLADEVAHFLHGFSEISFSGEEEGELSILETEIGKMVRKLRAQTEALQRDKSYLADSIADISHQLRTPLTSLNLIVSRLKGSANEPEVRKQYIREMETLLVHVDWLVETLLKISRLDAGIVPMKSEPISVAELLEQAAEGVQVPMELRGQKLICDIKKEVSVSGDFPWMKEALMNVMKNCMEHTPEKGEIEITAEDNPLYVEIRIGDNGPGICEQDLPHLFERFYRGRTSAENSIGIGLALANSIICEQGGVITAENRKTGGAEFIIRFYKAEKLIS